MGTSTRSPQCGQGWCRKAEQSFEEEEVKEYYDFAADSSSDKGNAMEVPVEEGTIEY